MNKIGVITEIINNEAIVMLASSASCGNCGCSVKTRKDGELCDNNQYIKVNNKIDGKVGDPVSVEFKTSEMLKTSIMLYLIPLILLVAGIFLGMSVQTNELISFLIGVVFMAISYIVLNKLDKKQSKDDLIVISPFKGY